MSIAAPPLSSLRVLGKIERLTETGRLDSVIGVLSRLPAEHVRASPQLSLFLGMALARLGQHEAGERWVKTALEGARDRGDQGIKARALNASGAIALEAGRTAEATMYFSRALAEAEHTRDYATLGRCSNNLGIIASMHGLYGRATGHYTMAMGAFRQAGLRDGVATAHHNLSINYRDQGNLPAALAMANRAVYEATAAGNRALSGQTIAGRAEIHLLRGNVAVARREIDQALQLHREMGDAVLEAEDCRVLAGVCEAEGSSDEAEELLRSVIRRAEGHGRPLLVAQAERDLACILLRKGRGRAFDAGQSAHRARVLFEQAGAHNEIRRLEQMIAEASGRRPSEPILFEERRDRAGQ